MSISIFFSFRGAKGRQRGYLYKEAALLEELALIERRGTEGAIIERKGNYSREGGTKGALLERRGH